MNGETFNVDPDFSVLFGCRSTLSLIGLATGLVGYWIMERQWDNQGPAALELAQEAGQVGTGDDETGNGTTLSYVNMNDPDKVVGQAFHHSGARDLVRVRTEDGKSEQYHPGQSAGTQTEPIRSAVAAQYYGTPEGAKAHLASVLPVPKMMLTGLGLWSLSFALDPAIGGLRFYANFFNISCLVLSALIGPLLAFPMRKAVLERDIEYKKKLLVAFVLISVLIATFSIADPEVDAPWYFIIVAGEYCTVDSNVAECRDMGRRLFLCWKFLEFFCCLSVIGSCRILLTTLVALELTNPFCHHLAIAPPTWNSFNRLVHLCLSRGIFGIAEDGIHLVVRGKTQDQFQYLGSKHWSSFVDFRRVFVVGWNKCNLYGGFEQFLCTLLDYHHSRLVCLHCRYDLYCSRSTRNGSSV